LETGAGSRWKGSGSAVLSGFTPTSVDPPNDDASPDEEAS
jgi:hypothetical protein